MKTYQLGLLILILSSCGGGGSSGSQDESIAPETDNDDSLNEKLEDINYDKDLEKSATKNLDDFENNDHIYDLNNYSEEKYTKSDKIPEKISEFNKNDITISNLLKSDKSLKLKRKLFETKKIKLDVLKSEKILGLN